MDIKKIKAIIDLVVESGIAELEIAEGEDRLKISTAKAQPLSHPSMCLHQPHAPHEPAVARDEPVLPFVEVVGIHDVFVHEHAIDGIALFGVRGRAGGCGACGPGGQQRGRSRARAAAPGLRASAGGRGPRHGDGGGRLHRRAAPSARTGHAARPAGAAGRPGHRGLVAKQPGRAVPRSHRTGQGAAGLRERRRSQPTQGLAAAVAHRGGPGPAVARGGHQGRHVEGCAGAQDGAHVAGVLGRYDRHAPREIRWIELRQRCPTLVDDCQQALRVVLFGHQLGGDHAGRIPHPGDLDGGIVGLEGGLVGTELVVLECGIDGEAGLLRHRLGRQREQRRRCDGERHPKA
mgnify:CR=1 FL=1